MNKNGSYEFCAILFIRLKIKMGKGNNKLELSAFI